MPEGAAAREPDRIAVAFARILRGSGLSVPVGSVVEYARALAAVGLVRPAAVYWAGRATLVNRPEDVADNIPCGPDLDELVEGVKPFWEAGFTDVALVQIGGDHQYRFLDEVAEPLLEKLRAAAG